MCEREGATGEKMRGARGSAVFVVGGEESQKEGGWVKELARERGNGLWPVRGSRTGPRLERTLILGGGRKTSRGFCAKQRYLSAMGGTGG